MVLEEGEGVRIGGSEEILNFIVGKIYFILVVVFNFCKILLLCFVEFFYKFIWKFFLF